MCLVVKHRISFFHDWIIFLMYVYLIFIMYSSADGHISQVMPWLLWIVWPGSTGFSLTHCFHLFFKNISRNRLAGSCDRSCLMLGETSVLFSRMATLVHTPTTTPCFPQCLHWFALSFSMPSAAFTSSCLIDSPLCVGGIPLWFASLRMSDMERFLHTWTFSCLHGKTSIQITGPFLKIRFFLLLLTGLNSLNVSDTAPCRVSGLQIYSLFLWVVSSLCCCFGYAKGCFL